jgi:4-diphosphocytidyl-2-C-methyl-D-erythritol kinase
METFASTIPRFEGEISPDGRKVFISAPAKINLFLKVLRKRPDGYHDILSWFQALDLADHLEIETIDSDHIEIITETADIPTGPDNLVYQAADLVRGGMESPPGLRVRIWKHIPVAAGLGGGSSDAAACIKALNRLFGLGLSRAEMEEIGLRIGSDVPFFFGRGQAEVTGRGENVRDLDFPLDYRVLLATPPLAIRAAEAYEKVSLDLTNPFAGISLSHWRQAREFFCAISGPENDLEKALCSFYPILEKIRVKLEGTGADIVRLSGKDGTVDDAVPSSCPRNARPTYTSGRNSTVEITEIRITLRDEEKLKGFANVTFDNSFVVRGLKIIAGNSGYFVSMPSRKRPDGTHQDICHPINNETRQMIEDRVLEAYEKELKTQTAKETT